MPLILVPTPLGNLRDVTLRALDELRACDLLVAEDTRTARRLLSALDLPGKELASYREESGPALVASLVERARTERVVLTSDAGMPAISDPGRVLVAAARAAGVAVEVLPGPSAFVVAAVLSGFPLEHLCFAGFMPRANKDRATALRAALERVATTVFYESPQRIDATLAALGELAAHRPCFVARELTKLHEQQVLGTPAEVRARLPAPKLGEIVLVIRGADGTEAPPSDVNLEGLACAFVDARIAGGTPAATVAKELARLGFDRNEAYRLVQSRKTGR